jgi:Flp pilus assembly pilin Flp
LIVGKEQFQFPPLVVVVVAFPPLSFGEPDMLERFWLDEGGAIISAELCLIMVLLVIGMVVGLTALRDAIDFQLADIAGAIAALDTGYEFTGLTYTGICSSVTTSAKVHGSSFIDTWDKGGTANASTLLKGIDLGP